MKVFPDWSRPYGFSATRAIFVLFGLGAAAMAAWLFAESRRPPEVAYTVAARRDVVRTIIAAGKIAPQSRVRIGSSVLGTAAEVLFSEGARVRFGDVLVRLDDAEAAAAVDSARASVMRAEIGMQSLRDVIMPGAGEELREADAAFERAKEEFERVDNLVKGRAASAKLLDEARTALDVARSRQARAALKASSMAKCGPEHRLAVAAMVAAAAALDAAAARASQFTICAPSDAVVLRRLVEPGDMVSPGKVLLELAAGGPMELLVPIDEKNLSGVVRGVEAVAAADGFPDTRFAAVVAGVAPWADPARGTVDVRMRMPDPPGFLVADMTVTVEMKVERKKGVITLPFESLRDAAAARPWVLVNESGTARRREVRLGLRGDGFVEIIEGLAGGEQVLLPGKTALADKTKIRAVQAAEAGQK